MIRRPPRSTQSRSSAASDVYKRQVDFFGRGWPLLGGSVLLLVLLAVLVWKLSLIHISEPTRLGMLSYAVFCLKKKKATWHRYGPDHDPVHVSYTHIRHTTTM